MITRNPRAWASRKKHLEIAQRAISRMDVFVVGDVVAVVFPWRRTEGQKPERRNTEIMKIVELLGEAGEIAHAVAVFIVEGADMYFINDGIFVPQRIVGQSSRVGHGARGTFCANSRPKSRLRLV